jgi:hypothetical protein
MTEILYETVLTASDAVRIDREAGVLFGVKIIGCESKNGRHYPNETLRSAIPLYENSKVNLDHPEGEPRKSRSYHDRFGMIRNVHLRENEGLFADFWFNPKHSIAEQLLWDAEHAPDNVGFSHNVEAIVRRQTADGSRKMKALRRLSKESWQYEALTSLLTLRQRKDFLNLWLRQRLRWNKSNV